MTYYDHGTALAFKLEPWSETRSPRNFTQEAAACEQSASIMREKRPSVFRQLVKGTRFWHKASQARPQSQG